MYLQCRRWSGGPSCLSPWVLLPSWNCVRHRVSLPSRNSATSNWSLYRSWLLTMPFRLHVYSNLISHSMYFRDRSIWLHIYIFIGMFCALPGLSEPTGQCHEGYYCHSGAFSPNATGYKVDLISCLCTLELSLWQFVSFISYFREKE